MVGEKLFQTNLLSRLSHKVCRLLSSPVLLSQFTTIICMDPHSPNKLFPTKYCFLILGDEFLFLNHFFICRFFVVVVVFFVILLLLIFTKTMLLLSFNLIFFFMKITFIFSCSGMFRNVPECSMFLVLSTPLFPSLPSELKNNRVRNNAAQIIS